MGPNDPGVHLTGHPRRGTPADWPDTVLVVDVANVVGSVPDGWWRDRVGAAEALLASLNGLIGLTVNDRAGDPIRLGRVVAVLEGGANRAQEVPGGDERLVVVRAPGSGDDAIADLVTERVEAGDRVLVVTADRGLRARLPESAEAAGPGWLNALLGRG